ncbi:cytochrome c3 family protein [Geoalkalibacter halelectricus]|uniref:Doubled CXXCH motif domain-containing protein n=1 Tax=Geoalkalibacter halelectricus TaxID=2847045 RepID=A0ABY5ZPT3_9BACT|nr:cytochrome c3 family protein [Geoalkalibacter halelectricus]MDO3376957.1 hypothetical protein [Geoalkalibacter halelectricus]UWZ81180.1 hypothetical protein L9S41_07225 [Geoalkalibacter halelectricus]
MKQRLIGLGMVLLAVMIHVAATAWAAVDPKSLGYMGGQNAHPHNLSSLNTNADGIHAPPGGEDQICKFCHTPHGASNKGPLWNRPDPLGPNFDGSFPLYGQNSGRLGEIEINEIAAAKYGGDDYPNGATRLCLSCHDGVTAIGEVLNGPPLASLTMSERGTIDLDTSHPVSFVYNEEVLAAIMTVPQKADQYQLPHPDLRMLDNQGRMQCTTCHDPHFHTKGGTYTLPMWRNYTGFDNDDYEAACAACHVGGSSSPGLIRPSGPNHPIP